MRFLLLIGCILATILTATTDAFSTAPTLPVRIITTASSRIHRQLTNSKENELIEFGDEDELDEATLAEVEAGKPSNWMVIQQMFGINVFTYILAAAIAFFFSMNVILGPGWLGNQIGIPSTGTFDEISNSLPQTIDLSDPAYRI